MVIKNTVIAYNYYHKKMGIFENLNVSKIIFNNISNKIYKYNAVNIQQKYLLILN